MISLVHLISFSFHSPSSAAPRPSSSTTLAFVPMCICPACKALGHHFVRCTSFIFGKGGSSRISRVMSETDEDEFSFHMNVEFWKNDPCKQQLHFATFDSDRPP